MRTSMTAVAVLALGVVGAPVALAAQEAPTVEAVLATGIEDMMPVGEATEFAADVGRVFLWTRVTGGTGTSIQHVWIPPDGNEFPVSLQVGGSPWRTWSSKEIPPEWAGEWRVEIRDSAGNVLGTESFTVGA